MPRRSIYWTEPATLRRLMERAVEPDAAGVEQRPPPGRFRGPGRGPVTSSAAPRHESVKPLKLSVGDRSERLEGVVDQLMERRGIRGTMLLDDAGEAIVRRQVQPELAAFVTQVVTGWRATAVEDALDPKYLQLVSTAGVLHLCDVDAGRGGRVVAVVLADQDLDLLQLEALRHALHAALLM